MITFDKPFEYNPATGKWSLELHKAPKLFSSQAGFRITIDAGTPTGETGAYYNLDEKPAMKNSVLELRYFDNLAGYTSIVEFDLPVLINKLIEIMPKENVRMETFTLANKDRKEVGEL
jgi:hypothetical protein